MLLELLERNAFIIILYDRHHYIPIELVRFRGVCLRTFLQVDGFAS